MGTLIVAEEVPNITGTHTVHPDCHPDAHGGEYRCQGRVWMLYSTSDRVTQWGTISSIGIDESAKNVICHQLGYNKSVSNVTQRKNLTDDTPPIWLTDVNNCGNGDGNILQCNHRLCELGSKCYNHSLDLIVYCGESLS